MRSWVSAAVVAALVGSMVTAADRFTEPAGPPSAPVTEAPDTATAMALARAQGSRVEVLDQRTETRTVYAEPHGAMAAELTVRPVRVKRAGGWAAPDQTLAFGPDGLVRPRAVAADVAFSGGGSAPMAHYGRDGGWLALSWPGALPVPLLSGDTATYREVLPGVDLQLKATVEGFTQYLVVKDARAAANPAVSAVRLGLRTGGVTLRATKDGALEARNAAGTAVFVAPVPEMWDSAPMPRRAVVKATVDGASLVLRPDRALLTDPATVYPVTVDPAWQPPFGPSVWTKVFSGKPDTNYLNGRNDVDAWAKVGQCWDGHSECRGIGEAWSYFQFDTRFLAGKTMMDGSYLRVTEVWSPSGDTRRHELHLAEGTIYEGTTWRNKPEGPHLWGVDMPCAGRTNCSARVDADFQVGPYIRAGGVTAYYLRAHDWWDTLAWRKYDPWATKLFVRYNTPPNLPDQLATDPPLRPACTNCNGVRYFSGSSVTLKTRLSDPDGDSVRPAWRLFHNGNLKPEYFGPFLANGLTHSEFVDLANRHGQTFGWEVYASDGTDSRGYSFGTGFTIDQQRPTAKPNITPGLYREDNRWHGGVDVPGDFTFDANQVGDVDSFLWGWTDPPTTPVDADALGGKAVLKNVKPPGDGPRDLFVRSVDRAGNQSDSKQLHFYVRAGSGPLAQWSFEGSTEDEAFLGDRDGTLGGTATYGSGAVGLGLQLDGQSPTVMTAPNTVGTDASFSVSAWVKPNPLRAGQVVGQDGGFSLAYREDLNRWAFTLASMSVVAPDVPQPGVWTHLTGVYDRQANRIRLYVNGVLAADQATPASPRTAGQFVAGPWSGGIDEVKVYDRALSTAEVAFAVGRDNVQVGQWTMDDLAGTSGRNAVGGGEMLALLGGASFTGDSTGDGLADGGAVGGALRLDGVDDHAVTSGPAVRTDQSFTVAAWVNLGRLGPSDNAQTIVSQSGTEGSGFLLQQRNSTWQFVMPEGDTPTAYPIWAESAPNTAQTNQWTHVAGVYDATARRGYLYVNGQQAASVAGSVSWNATGRLVVGRVHMAGVDFGYLQGLVDELRVYSRAVPLAEIQALVSRDNVPLAMWKLDGTADGATPAQRGTLLGGTEWAGGQTAVPDPSDLAVRLNGGTAFVSTPVNVDVTRSFSVSAWARLDSTGSLRTVVSQDGNRVSGFKLRATPDGRWSFVMFDSDVDGGGGRAEVFGGAAQVGVWTHLVATHDAGADRLSLYVNGVLAGSVAHTHGWTYPSGRVQIGRARAGTADVEFFHGAIDDVIVHGRVLFADEIRVAAGRDLTLAHNWTLDESSGPAAADAVGTRAATLAGGASRAPGRLGNAVQLDGVDDRVSTAGVDVRTDASFTVTAWVRLTRRCEPGPAGLCRFVAVSLDGTSTSKFRLGHIGDTDQYQEGIWVFEMSEADTPGAPARAAVSIIPSDLTSWTHLAGVYDRPANKLWLYVNGLRKGDATLNTPWHATGGLQIGRSMAPDEYFPGAVDDVRLYSGLLDDGRIDNLYQSYLTQDGPAVLPRADAAQWKLDEGTGVTAGDISGRGIAATLRGGTTWSGGRNGNALRFDGTTGYADTAGPVLDITRSFSATAWVVVQQSRAAAGIVSQDGVRNSAFQLDVRGDAGNAFGIVVPGSTTVDNPTGNTLLVSPQPALLNHWYHVGMVYDANLRQIRLYVNGVLSAAQVGVTVPAGTGPFAIGRAKWNGQLVDQFPGVIDDVRVFSKALTDGEMRRVHDDVPAALIDAWNFDDGTTRATSYRNNHATMTGTATYPTGISGVGKALGLDGASYATASFAGTSQRASFTVSAWAYLTRKDRTATVLAQDGTRMSSFVLQYLPRLDRWVFGQAERDADSMPLVVAASGPPAVANQWVQLTGVYDHPAAELRLYVDGVLSGRRTGYTMWAGDGPITIGRSRVNGVPGELFTGKVDEIRTDLGVVPDDDIARRAGWPPPAPGQLARYYNAAGDHYTGDAAVPPRPGYHFEGPMGAAVPAGPDTRMLYACVAGSDGFTSTDPACEGGTRVGDVGLAYTVAPSTVNTVPLRRCISGTDRFDTRQATCTAGATEQAVLGYVLGYVKLSRYVSPLYRDHWESAVGTMPGYTLEGGHGYLSFNSLPGTRALMSCRDGVDQFNSTDAACEGKQVLGLIGYLWTSPPAGPPSVEIKGCLDGTERFTSRQPDCEGRTVVQSFGYLLTVLP